MLYKIRLVCDGSFAKSRDIDREVGKVLKMFKDRLDTKSKPLGDNSDMECVYEYTSLSRDELRIMKKLLKTNGPLVRLKSMESTPIPATVAKGKRKTKKNDSSDSEVETPSVSTSSVSAHDFQATKTHRRFKWTQRTRPSPRPASSASVCKVSLKC